MGSSDLNLKKSWHVGRAANITATAKAEAAAIEERKKTAARLAEIREERKKEEIQKQLAATTGKVVQERVEWMYSGGPSDGANGDSAANEAYLLGKRSLNNLLQDQEAKKLSKQASLESFAAVQKVASVRDTATKIREDPLLAIKRQEQQAYEAVMNDPIKRRQLLAQMGIDDSKSKSGKSKDKEERRHKHRHHHRHRRDSGSEEDRSTRKRRRSDSRDRSRSPRRYGSEDDDRRRKTRRESPEDRRSKRHSPDRRRSYSPTSREERDYTKSRDSRRREPSRSRSPPRKRRDGSRDRTDRKDSYRGRDDQNGRTSYRPRGGGYGQERPRNGDGKTNGDYSRSDKKSEDDEERRARKLAEMQAAASELDVDRERRLKALEEAERAAREAEDKARQRSSKIGGDRHFMNGLQLKAGDMDLAERIGRGKKGLVRDED
jgi:hypothetical protein